MVALRVGIPLVRQRVFGRRFCKSIVMPLCSKIYANQASVVRSHSVLLCSTSTQDQGVSSAPIPTLSFRAITRLYFGPLALSVLCSAFLPCSLSPSASLSLACLRRPPCNFAVSHITDAVVPLQPGWKTSPVFPSSPSSPPAGPPTPTPPHTATGPPQQLRNTT